jgi:hypothetical protein
MTTGGLDGMPDGADRPGPNVGTILVLLIVVGMSLVATGALVFKTVWDEHTFPKGAKEEGKTYIVEGEVHGAFSREPGKYYNSTTGKTSLPIAYGEDWRRMYNISGDIRDRYHSGDTVLLTTVWNGSLDEGSQNWTVEQYHPPHLSYALGAFIPALGALMVVASVFIRKGGPPIQTGLKIACSILPSLAVLPGYYIGAALPDACASLLCLLIGACLLPFLFFAGRALREYDTSRKQASLAKAAVIIILVVVVPAMAVGSMCELRYINWFP